MEFTSGKNYYDLLADAFLNGQLHLNVAPAPELLALTDPYDSLQNRPYLKLDFSLFDDRYYLYFGPVPGLIHAAWKRLTGLPLETSTAGLLFGLGGCAWFWLLLCELRQRVFPWVPEAIVLAVYACYALGGPALYLQVNSSVYTEAALAASFFTLGGSYFWLRGLTGGRSATGQLCLAGLLFGCGFGSRTVGIGYALSAGLVLAWPWLRDPRNWSAARRALAFALPPTAILILLLLYNYARFGSFTEFGTSYQLTGLVGVTSWYDLRFVPDNLAAYILFTPRFFGYYPFEASVSCYDKPLPSYPWGVGVQGWCLEAPFIAIPLLAPLALLSPLSILVTTRAKEYAWSVRQLVLASTGGLIFALGILLSFRWATVRYMQDFLPAVCLLGGLGLWELRRRARPSQLGRLVYRGAAVILMIISLSFGFLLALAGLADRFPETYLRMAYGADQATATVLSTMAPGLWPASYLTDEVRERPLGIFYPEQSTVPLPAPSGPIASLEIWSLLPRSTRMVVEIDGRVVSDAEVHPGRQRLRLVGAPTVALADRLNLRLHLVDEPERSPGSLWPVAVGTLRSNQ